MYKALSRTLSFSSALVVLALALPHTVEAAASKITICHRTHSVTNPYRRISVAQSAITKNNGHGDQGASNTHNKASVVNPTRLVFDPTYTYPANEKVWDDIVPDATAGGSSGIAQNFAGAGLAIYNGTVFNGQDYANACKKMSAKEFYDSEIAAGESSADILADLQEQDATEDLALKAALGGTFVGSNPGTFNTLVSASTVAASEIASTSSKLNGTLVLGPTVHKIYFHFGTSPTLSTKTVLTASPATGSSSVTAFVTATALNPSTTYYFRVVGVANEGTDQEAEIQGQILSLSTPAVTTTTTTPGSTTTTPGSTTTIPSSTTTTPGSTTTSPGNKTAQIENPDGSKTPAEVSIDAGRIRVGSPTISFSIALNDSVSSGSKGTEIKSGGQFSISGSGFKAGSQVEVTLSPSQSKLATATSDQSGAFSSKVSVPSGVSGASVIRVSGLDQSGTQRVISYAVTISPASTELPGTGPDARLITLILASVAGTAGLDARRRTSLR